MEDLVPQARRIISVGEFCGDQTHLHLDKRA
jgi:hypothetical protein